MKLYGLILENTSYIDEFFHLHIILRVKSDADFKDITSNMKFQRLRVVAPRDTESRPEGSSRKRRRPRLCGSLDSTGKTKVYKLYI